MPKNGLVVLTPNEKLAAFFKDLGIRTVADVYRPAEKVTEAEWAGHDGHGTLPYFKSMRAFLSSEWLRRFLMPKEGAPLGEGLVVASEVDGRLFKLKHGGEELGNMPELLQQACETLGALEMRAPSGMLEVFDGLRALATAKPIAQAATEPNAPKSAAVDNEALMALESALTKFETLDEVFAKGQKAKALREKELIAEVARDLQKDYGDDKTGVQRATKVVMRIVGARFGAWKRDQQA